MYMKTDEKKALGVSVRVWKWIAIISGIFAFLMCFLVIANFIQINRLDPINTEAVNKLVVRLSENPNDKSLREEIRALDLLVRKAYFTNQWQVRAGGYLILISVALMFIATQIINSTKSIDPKLSELSDDRNDQILKKISRKWISFGGISIVIIALVLAFLTHEKLSNKFIKAAIAEVVQDSDDSGGNSSNSNIAPSISSEKTNKQDVEKEKTEEKDTSVKEKKSESEKSVTVSKETMVSVVDETSQYILNARKNFPSFRGAGGLGIAYQKNIPTQWDGVSNQNIVWKVALDYKGYNSPIVWDNKLFLTGADENSREIYCYNKDTGELIWKKAVTNVQGSPLTAPKVSGDTGHAASTACTDGERVYAIFANGDIAAVDMKGNLVWSKNLGVPQNHYGHSSSLLVYGDKVIVQYDHGQSAKILTLSTLNGNEIWSTARPVKISWASPVIINRNNQTEIVLISDPNIAGYDVKTGKELWKIDCIYGEVGPSIAYSDGIVFGINEYASLVAISGGNQPTVLWEEYDYLSDVPSPVATKDFLFVVTSYGMVICHDTKTGEKYWEKEFNNGFYSSPIIVEDKIYLIDRKGFTYIFNADKKYQLISNPALGENVVSTPAFADGQIFIRAEKHLFCIGNEN